MRPLTVHRSLLLAVGSLAACGGDLPLRERIASTRPLAMRVEAVDPMADAEAAVRTEMLPFERVRVVPWVVDDEGPLSLDEVGQELDPVWLACALQPVEGLFGCLSSSFPLDPADVPACPEVTPTDFDPNAGMIPEAPSPCLITGGTPAQPELTVPLDPVFLLGGDLEVTMIAHIPGEGSTQTCMEVLFEEPNDLPASCIYATQRVPVGPDAMLAQLAVDFGIADPEQLGAIPETIPDPDANPRIQRVTVTAFDADDTPAGTFDVARGEVLQLPPETRLELEAEAPEGDLQTYLVQRDNDEFVEREEVYEAQWFRTWGELLGATSNDPLAINTWTLVPGEQDPDDTPPGNRATLFYVLRDDRQGVDWWWFHVDLMAAP